MHGGGSLAGIAHPNWKHGRHSKVIAGLGPLAESYKHARQNPTLVALTDDIALLDARNEQLFGRLATGESQDAWAQARDALQRLREAKKTRDGAAMVTALTALTAAVEHGQNDAAIWAEITTNLYLRKKLVDSESRRRKDAQEMVTQPQLFALIGGLLAVVQEVVIDRHQKQQIVDRVRGLIPGPRR